MPNFKKRSIHRRASREMRKAALPMVVQQLLAIEKEREAGSSWLNSNSEIRGSINPDEERLPLLGNNHGKATQYQDNIMDGVTDLISVTAYDLTSES
jgi:hypothetical protein